MEGNRIKKGDRLVAVNGRSLENVSYANAIDLIKKSGDSVHFLVSQLKDQSQLTQHFIKKFSNCVNFMLRECT